MLNYQTTLGKEECKVAVQEILMLNQGPKVLNYGKNKR